MNFRVEVLYGFDATPYYEVRDKENKTLCATMDYRDAILIMSALNNYTTVCSKGV
jgi:hypothetical protein